MQLALVLDIQRQVNALQTQLIPQLARISREVPLPCRLVCQEMMQHIIMQRQDARKAAESVIKRGMMAAVAHLEQGNVIIPTTKSVFCQGISGKLLPQRLLHSPFREQRHLRPLRQIRQQFAAVIGDARARRRQWAEISKAQHNRNNVPTMGRRQLPPSSFSLLPSARHSAVNSAS